MPLKFIEECNQLLSGGVADSARCMGLCVHCMCRSTMPVSELLANDWKWTMATSYFARVLNVYIIYLLSYIFQIWIS